MRAGANKAFVISFIIGFLLWAFSPILFGRKEPWDGDATLYLGILLATGCFTTALLKSRARDSYFGIVAGQAVFGFLLFITGNGALFPIGIVVMFIYSLPTLLGGMITAWASGSNPKPPKKNSTKGPGNTKGSGSKSR